MVSIALLEAPKFRTACIIFKSSFTTEFFAKWNSPRHEQGWLSSVSRNLEPSKDIWSREEMFRGFVFFSKDTEQPEYLVHNTCNPAVL